MNKPRFAEEKAHAVKLACGRTFDEQAAAIEKCGNHGASDGLRNSILAAHGIANPKPNARHGIMFGCYRPFTTPFLLHDYIRLLDLLGVDYTWFEREYCCGLPFVMEPEGGSPEKIAELRGNSNARNQALAAQKRVETLAYCCIGCAYAAKDASSKLSEGHVYILDLISDAMEKKHHKMSLTQVGYFEGCHSFYRSRFPDVRLGWTRYRSMLENIDGLSVVDIPPTSCCKRAAAKIIDTAQNLHVTQLVCPCNGCYVSLKAAAQNKLQVLTMPELLLRCFDVGQ